MDFANLGISPELREKAKACTSPEELLALAKTEGYKLSEADLEAVAGGGCGGSSSPCTTLKHRLRGDETPPHEVLRETVVNGTVDGGELD